MSWKEYVDTSLVGTGKFDKAAICSREGNSIWASSPGFDLKLNELSTLASGFDNPSQVQASGFYLSQQKYVTIRAEDRSIYGKQGCEGVYCVRTHKVIIIGHFPKTTQAGEAAKIIEALADYLISAGF
ncbi:hypothetical protein PNEG_02179 [Pneumocystis murina B123]|uniref:Profilin n=1 Tax=Pneumocystis murina (strain B123) TaxID=1069680 RepID=M7P6T2_PNEMU|nr:hypothetical protein PNEG_02179 [Pneumocystis murina B123]EMR09595.1 hypothetical protein PNEG_02179 [Pneumocystis murina B123]